MSHSFKAFHNLNILKMNNLNANPEKLLKFFQVKYFNYFNLKPFEIIKNNNEGIL